MCWDTFLNTLDEKTKNNYNRIISTFNLWFEKQVTKQTNEETLLKYVAESQFAPTTLNSHISIILNYWNKKFEK